MKKYEIFYIKLSAIRDFSRRFNVSYKEAIEILYAHFNQINYKIHIHPKEINKIVFEDEDQGICSIVESILY